LEDAVWRDSHAQAGRRSLDVNGAPFKKDHASVIYYPRKIKSNDALL